MWADWFVCYCVARAVGAAQVFAIEVKRSSQRIAKEMKADLTIDPQKKMRAPSWPNEQMARAQMSCSRWRVTLTLFEQLSTSCGVVPYFAPWTHLKTNFAKLFRRHYF